jgi:hypothetical protein
MMKTTCCRSCRGRVGRVKSPSGRGDGTPSGRRVDWEVKKYLHAACTGAKDADGSFVDRGVYRGFVKEGGWVLDGHGGETTTAFNDDGTGRQDSVGSGGWQRQ